MPSAPSIEAQNRFGKPTDHLQRRTEAANWYAQYRAEVLPPDMVQSAAALTDEQVNQWVDELR